VAQFGSAPVLGTGGRRFKSFHPDMQIIIAVASVTLVIELVLFFLLVRHIKYATSLFNNYKDVNTKESDIEDKIEMYQDKILELEERNKKLELENKLLQEKINKINKQMKQISEHFKTN
jgi:peptidoglycan hydrolase CwlO-like protein